MGRPVVSVMVACHPPYVKFIEECLVSIMRQLADFDQGDVQLVIGYDSTELDSDLRAILDRLGISVSHVVLHRCGESQVLKNRCARDMQGRYYLFVDADNWLEDGFLKRSVDALEPHKNAVIAYPRLLHFGDRVAERPVPAE